MDLVAIGVAAIKAPSKPCARIARMSAASVMMVWKLHSTNKSASTISFRTENSRMISSVNLYADAKPMASSKSNSSTERVSLTAMDLNSGRFGATAKHGVAFVAVKLYFFTSPRKLRKRREQREVVSTELRCIETMHTCADLQVDNNLARGVPTQFHRATLARRAFEFGVCWEHETTQTDSPINSPD